MLPELRKKLKNVSSKNRSLQDILRTATIAKSVLTVDAVDGGTHNTKVTVTLPGDSQRVQFYNRLDLNKIMTREDVIGQGLEEIISNANARGYDFTIDDLEIIDGRLHAKSTSLGYYSLIPIDAEDGLPPWKPKTGEQPMILSYLGGRTITVRSHSPLKVDFGEVSNLTNDRDYNSTYKETVQDYDGVKVYTYSSMIYTYTFTGNKIRITHKDGRSPIDWIDAPGLIVEQWYGGGYSSFKCKVPDYDHGIGPKYIVPDTPPPKSPNLSYLFHGESVGVDISQWDMRGVSNVDYLFQDTKLLRSLDLSKWSTGLIKTPPLGWENISGESLTLPTWGKDLPFIPLERDLDSLIICMLLGKEFRIVSDTRLIIDPGKTGYLFKETTKNITPRYTYIGVRENESVNMEQALAVIKVRPNSSEEKIVNFGCNRAMWLKQWWSGGHDGFNTEVGVGSNMLPDAQPMNTTNISGLFIHDYMSVSSYKHWDMGQYKNFSSLFANRSIVPADLSAWDMSNAENTSRMFYYARYLGKTISNWNMGRNRNMDEMFYGCEWFFDIGELTDTSTSYPEAHDLTLWCVPYIETKPTDVNGRDSYLTDDRLPVWGTCPRGEHTPSEKDEPVIDPYVSDWMEVTGFDYATSVYTGSELEFGSDENLAVTKRTFQNQEGEPVLNEYVLYWNQKGPVKSDVLRLRNAEYGKPIKSLTVSDIRQVIKWYSGGYTVDERYLDMPEAIPIGLGAFVTDVPPVIPPNTTNLYGFFANCWDLDSENVTKWDFKDVVDLTYFLKDAQGFSGDLKNICVTNITSEPVGFAEGTSLTKDQYPVWGTCPKG